MEEKVNLEEIASKDEVEKIRKLFIEMDETGKWNLSEIYSLVNIIIKRKLEEEGIKVTHPRCLCTVARSVDSKRISLVGSSVVLPTETYVVKALKGELNENEKAYLTLSLNGLLSDAQIKEIGYSVQ